VLLEENEQDLWFQQGEVITHIVKTSPAVWYDFLAIPLSGMGFSHQTLHHLTFFFLYEFLEEKFYIDNPRSMQDLKHNSEQAVASVDHHSL
jgi:hypothetical protein